MKPSQLPDSFLAQRTRPLDATSHWEAAHFILCWECGKKMPGDKGIMTAVKLAGSDVCMHVVRHLECQ